MALHHFLRDPILIVLLCGSLLSWAIIGDRLLALARAVRADRRFRQGADDRSAPLHHIRTVINNSTGTLHEHLLILADTAITLQRQRLSRALPLLGVIGSTAPYVGLLGTVVGIIQAFQAIQTHNNMSPSIVAGGIATALVATATGLAVAIPAVAAHHLISAAINRQAALWEAAVAEWLPEIETKGVYDEPLSLA